MNATARKKFFNAIFNVMAVGATILLVLNLWIFVLIVAVQAAEPTTPSPPLKARLSDTITLTESKTATADVVGTRVDGQLTGKVRVEPAGNSTRVNIEWNTLTQRERGVSTSVPLSKPMQSRFLVKSPTVTPGTIVAIAGDLAIVQDAGKKLADKIETAKFAGAKAAIAGPGAGAANSPARFGNSAVGGAAEAPKAADLAKGPTADLLTPKIVACPDRIDKAARYVFKQQKTDSVDSTGAVIKSTECSDIQPGYAIQKAYGGACTTLVDTTNRVAYKGYREFATVDGKEVEVTICTNETTVPFALTETSATCSVRNNLTAGVAIQQKKYYYTDNGTQVDATTCADSAEQYAIYQTTTTCSPIYDQATGLAFTQKRSAYDGPGGMAYVTDCAPVSTTGVAVSGENCSNPKYEHDFTTGVSYVLDRKYYMDGASKVYLTSCARSASVSYNHKHTTTTCTVTNDDTLLRTTFNQNTYISTPDDGTVEIKPCEAGNIVAYVTLSSGWIATSNGPDTLWAPSGYHQNKGTCDRARYWTWGDFTRAVAVSGLTNVSYAFIETWPDGQCSAWDLAYPDVTRGNYEKRSTFQRGDGSQLTRVEQTVTNAIGP